MNLSDLRAGLKSNKYSLYFFLLYSFLLLFSTSCGLPVYEALDPPVAASLGTGVNAVAFTSQDDDLIDGYVVYYKIYYSGDSLIRTEEKRFDPTVYENDNSNELDSGDSLPKQLGFYQLGYLNKTTIFQPQISLKGGGHLVKIDFTNSSSQTSTADPSMSINNISVSSDPDFGVPAREINYSDAGFGTYLNDSGFKRFVRNYEFDNSANYIDADLKQMLTRYQSAFTDTHPTVIEIAFVVYSYGISNTTLEPLSSIPVYLGTVKQDTFQNNILNAPDYN